jgi:hypothetical protein
MGKDAVRIDDTRGVVAAVADDNNEDMMGPGLVLALMDHQATYVREANKNKQVREKRKTRE